MDTRTPEQRRRIMQAVRSKDTGPELAVRRALFRLGHRFRLHRKDLPGKPDIVLPRYRLAIFVHGCFWHGHGCRYGQLPKARLDFWGPKIARNQARDAANTAAMEALGWRVLTVWQCQTRDDDALFAVLAQHLGDKRSSDDRHAV
jgi:DNA mismatch endonuclease (patch repair protein)